MFQARRSLTAAALTLTALAALSTPWDARELAAQDLPPGQGGGGGDVSRAVADTAGEAPGPTAEEDAAARKILQGAADRQGGRKLVAPEGRLESFRLVLHKVKFEVEKTNEQGGVTKTTIEADDDGLALFWKGEQLKTLLTIDGKRTQRGRFLRGGVNTPWMNDGQRTVLLTDAQYAKDLEQVERDGRIVRALLDVGLLRTMLSDGSRWRVIEDTSYEGIAIHRTPPAGKDVKLQLTLWVDAKTFRVNAARLWPNAADEAIMYYSFTYDDEFPEVRGDRLVFPFRFAVFEQLQSDKGPRAIMDGTVHQVVFNELTDDDLRPPVAKQR